jgi:hypothetical protein
MADFLQEINTILIANTSEVGSTTDWPVFRSHLPDDTSIDDRAVALLHTVGGPDEENVEVESPGLQVLVRGQQLNQVATSYTDAENIAFAVKNALRGFSGASSSGGRHVIGLWNESGPFFLGFDERKRPLFSNNFRVMRSRT